MTVVANDIPGQRAPRRYPVFPPGHPLIAHYLRRGWGVGVDYKLAPYCGLGDATERDLRVLQMGGTRKATPRVVLPKE